MSRLPAFLLLTVLSALGSAFAYNHPEIRWKSVTTAHFVINYYDKTEPAVYATWKIAESAFDRLAALYGYRSDRKISISLAEYDDFSNGFASWTDGSIMIWVPESRFDLRNSNTWLRNVIVHELAHIITLENSKRMQVLAYTLSLGYSDPTYTLSVQEPFARITAFPNWLAEGLAQQSAETHRGDCWDARRDMVLRCAVLDNRALTLDEMSTFNHNALGNEQIYNQGYALVRHLNATFGAEKISRIIRDAAASPSDVYRIFHERTGERIEQVYRVWIDSSRAHYARQTPPSPTPVQPIWSNGTFNTQPHTSRDGALTGWFTSQGDDYGRTDLLITGSGNGIERLRIPYASNAWEFSPDGKTVFYVKARDPNREGSFLNDLFAQKIENGTEIRLTWNKRIYDIAAAPDGNSFAVVFFDKGKYSLGTLAPNGTGLKTLVTGQTGSPIMHPSFDPSDPTRLVVNIMKQGVWQLYTVNVHTAALTPVLAAPFQCESPYWGTDGRIWFNADFDGIFNIYSIRPDGTGLLRHSTVKGGLFSPVLDKKNRVLCSEYTATGFRIVSIDADTTRATAYEIPANAACAYDSLEQPKGPVKINSKPYEARLLRSVWELSTALNIQYDDGIAYNYGTFGQGMFAMIMSRSDALQKKTVQFALQAGIIGGEIMQVDTTGNTPLRNNVLTSDLPIPAGMRTDSVKGISTAALRWKPDLRTALSHATLTGAPKTAAAGTTTPDSSLQGFSLLTLQPMLSYQNAMNDPTVGFDITIMTSGIVPAQGVADLYLNWQVARDVQIGAGLYGIAAPFSKEYMLAIPLVAQWVTTGYIHRSINYTVSDVTQVVVQAIPLVFPYLGVNADISAVRGIPLTHNSSLIIGGGLQPVFADHAIPDPAGVLYGESHTYLDAGLMTRLVFPLVPKINAGSWLYVDALYARIGWLGGIHANAEFMQKATMQQWFTAVGGDNPGRPGIGTYHVLEAALMSDMTKSYLFGRRAELGFQYSILLDKWYLNASLGF